MSLHSSDKRKAVNIPAKIVISLLRMKQCKGIKSDGGEAIIIRKSLSEDLIFEEN